MKSGFEKGIAASVLAGAMSMSGVALAAECIAPANPGGGWDFTCRTIGKIMYDIGVVDKPIQVTNMSGGGGGLAFSHVVNDRGEDGELIVAASSATATRLAQNAYAGHTADQVRFLGAIGADPGIIAVAADSPHASLVDLLDAVRADPSSVTFAGGSAAGGFDHLKVLMALGRTGFTDITRVKYIGVDGGADAITQTIGGHTQAMTGDMSEVVGFLKSGDIRVVAVFTDERVPGASALARYVGVEACGAAGGGVLRELFADGDENGVWLEDAALLRELARRKLQAVADELSTRWKWAEARLEVDWGEIARFGRIRPAPGQPTGEESAERERLMARRDELANLGEGDWTGELEIEAEALESRLAEMDEAIAARATFARGDFSVAGCIATLGRDDKLELIQGLVRPEDMPKADAAKAGAAAVSPPQAAPADPAAKARDDAGVGIGLADDLRAIRTALVKTHLAGDFDAAFDLAVFQFAQAVFADDTAEPEIPAFPRNVS